MLDIFLKKKQKLKLIYSSVFLVPGRFVTTLSTKNTFRTRRQTTQADHAIHYGVKSPEGEATSSAHYSTSCWWRRRLRKYTRGEQKLDGVFAVTRRPPQWRPLVALDEAGRRNGRCSDRASNPKAHWARASYRSSSVEWSFLRISIDCFTRSAFDSPVHAWSDTC